MFCVIVFPRGVWGGDWIGQVGCVVVHPWRDARGAVVEGLGLRGGDGHLRRGAVLAAEAELGGEMHLRGLSWG